MPFLTNAQLIVSMHISAIKMA